ncbi:unnamed protein product [[Candida] boidinii]|nr:unnamed protein product [[Candida] boidinii]
MLALRRHHRYLLLIILLILVTIGFLSTGNQKNTNQNTNNNNNNNNKQRVDPNKLVQSEMLGTLEENEQGIEVLEPCTVINPLSNSFFDLRSLGSLGQEGKRQAWNAKGFDYGRNFSLGICSTPLKNVNNLTELDFSDINNKTEVGGYYTDEEGNKVSIGQISTSPKFRGRKLVLEYLDGSFCKKTSGGETIRKSTILSFTCDREIMSKAQISYVGSLNDCSYFFEVRTIHACASAKKEDDLSLIWVFLFIFLAALCVYCFGSVVYSYFKIAAAASSGSSTTGPGSSSLLPTTTSLSSTSQHLHHDSKYGHHEISPRLPKFQTATFTDKIKNLIINNGNPIEKD